MEWKLYDLVVDDFFGFSYELKIYVDILFRDLQSVERGDVFLNQQSGRRRRPGVRKIGDDAGVGHFGDGAAALPDGRCDKRFDPEIQIDEIRYAGGTQSQAVRGNDDIQNRHPVLLQAIDGDKAGLSRLRLDSLEDRRLVFPEDIDHKPVDLLHVFHRQL